MVTLGSCEVTHDTGSWRVSQETNYPCPPLEGATENYKVSLHFQAIPG